MRGLGTGVLGAATVIALALTLGRCAGLAIDRETLVDFALAFLALFAPPALLPGAAALAVAFAMREQPHAVYARAARKLAQMLAGALLPGLAALLARAAT